MLVPRLYLGIFLICCQTFAFGQALETTVMGELPLKLQQSAEAALLNSYVNRNSAAWAPLAAEWLRMLKIPSSRIKELAAKALEPHLNPGCARLFQEKMLGKSLELAPPLTGGEEMINNLFEQSLPTATVPSAALAETRFWYSNLDILLHSAHETQKLLADRDLFPRISWWDSDIRSMFELAVLAENHDAADDLFFQMVSERPRWSAVDSIRFMKSHASRHGLPNVEYDSLYLLIASLSLADFYQGIPDSNLPIGEKLFLHSLREAVDALRLTQGKRKPEARAIMVELALEIVSPRFETLVRAHPTERYDSYLQEALILLRSTGRHVRTLYPDANKRPNVITKFVSPLVRTLMLSTIAKMEANGPIVEPAEVNRAKTVLSQTEDLSAHGENRYAVTYSGGLSEGEHYVRKYWDVFSEENLDYAVAPGLTKKIEKFNQFDLFLTAWQSQRPDLLVEVGNFYYDKGAYQMAFHSFYAAFVLQSTVDKTPLPSLGDKL